MRKITDNVYVENQLSVCNTSVVVTKDGMVFPAGNETYPQADSNRCCRRERPVS